MAALGIRDNTGIARALGAPLQSIAFGPQEGLLATGDTQRKVKVWHRQELLFDLDLSSKWDKLRPTERIRGLAFSPAGETLYTACGDQVRAFSLTTGEPRWSYRPARSFGFLIVSPIALAVSSNGDVAVATDAGRISVWTDEGAMKAHWWDNDSPRMIGFADGEQILGTDSFSVCSWKASLARKQEKRRLKERAYGFACTPDGSRFCLRSIRSVEVFDSIEGPPVASYPLDFGPPLVAISSDGGRLAFAGLNEVTVHEIGRSSQRIRIDSGSPRSLKFTPDGASVAVGCSDGSLRIETLDNL